MVSCVESGVVNVWSQSGECVSSLNVGPNVCRMRLNPENRNVLATGGKENLLKLWDLNASDSEKPIFTAKNVRKLMGNLKKFSILLIIYLKYF